MSLEALDSTLLLQILVNLKTRDLLAFGLVNKIMHGKTRDEKLWNALCVRTWRQLQLDDIDNAESIGEISWIQAYKNISIAFPIKFTTTTSTNVTYANIIISSNKFFPNITDLPSPPAAFRGPMGWDDFHELELIHKEVAKEPKQSSNTEEYHVDFALRIHGTSNDAYIGFSRRKEQRDLVEIVVVPLVEPTDIRDLSEIEQPLVLLIPFEIFDTYFGRRLSVIQSKDSPHTIAEMIQLLNQKKQN